MFSIILLQDVERAIHFYTKAQCYSPAIQLAKVYIYFSLALFKVNILFCRSMVWTMT